MIKTKYFVEFMNFYFSYIYIFDQMYGRKIVISLEILHIDQCNS